MVVVGDGSFIPVFFDELAIKIGEREVVHRVTSRMFRGIFAGMNSNEYAQARVLGRTGVEVGRLGIAGGYGAPAAAIEKAFERGCTYFYHGSLRRAGMTKAIKNLCAQGKRDRLTVVAQSYSRWGWHFRRSVEKFLRVTKLEYADVLLLGWYNSAPSQRILEICDELKRAGLARLIAVSGHNRPFFPTFASDERYGILHVRYNAAHRGAEGEVFDMLPAANRPGIVVYTATRWGRLIKARGLPADLPRPRGSDCYRFVLSHPAVDVCTAGPKNAAEMDEALEALARGPMTQDELAWMRRVGDHVHKDAAR